jgi:hypothetical protein
VSGPDGERFGRLRALGRRLRGLLGTNGEINLTTGGIVRPLVVLSQDWLFQRMASPAGSMSNAMESLDHMEPMNTRELLEEETVEVVSDLLIASENLDFDLVALLDDRWTEIEEESIL